MSEATEEVVISVPAPNSDGMVTLLGDLFEQMISHLPFQFSHGDVMSAALYMVIDAGLINAPSPEKLRSDIVDGLDRILAERAAERRQLN
jgi:hypothetical protein